MRKITLFLASLFATIGAMAQTYQVTDTKYTSTQLNSATKATYIAIKNLSATNHYYFVGNTGAAPYSEADFSNDAVFIWEPVKGETGKFYLKKLDGTYMQDSSPKDFAATTDNAAKFTTTNPTSAGSDSQFFNGDPDAQDYINGNDDGNLVRFVLDGGTTWINVQNGDAGTPLYNNGKGGWTIHYAYAVEEVTTANVSYKYWLNGELKKTIQLAQPVGAAYAAPAIDYVTFTQPEGVIPAKGATKDIDCTQNLPFTVSENFENATWYFMTIRSNSEKYVVRSTEAPYSNTTTINMSDDGLWAFIGNAFDGIQVINKGAGDGQTLGCDGTSTGSNIYMKDGNTSWIIEEGNGGFLLRQSGTNEYAHDYSNKLQFWNNASAASDPGSAFKVYSAAEALESLLQEWKESNTAGLGYVGGYPTSMKETINAISTYADAVAFDEANSDSRITLSTDSYYRLICVSPKSGNGGDTSYNTLTYNGASNLVTAPMSESNVNQIFKFETAGEGKYYLLNLNTNKYLNKISAGSYRSAVVEQADACIIEILALNAVAQWKLHNSESTNSYHCLFAENAPTEAVPYACSGWENGANSASAWYLLPVTELEVALTAVDGASYATGYYPFPVSASGNTTLNVGTLNADKNKLALTAVEGVPANTGVVIVNSAAEATATLAIGGEYEAAGSNALTGTYTAIALDGTNNANYLVFGRSEGVLGFYTPSSSVTEIPANKAFLAADAPGAVKLDLGGDVTAIENVELGTAANAPIFDLSGRRVLTPIKGGVYIQGGKKFIVK